MNKKQQAIVLLKGDERRVYEFIEKNPQTTLKGISKNYSNAMTYISQLKLKGLISSKRVGENNVYSITQGEKTK